MSDVKHNPMSENDQEAISWLEDRSKELPALYNAWQVLKAYYDSCLEQLKNIDTKDSPFKSDKERGELYLYVGKQIIDNDIFMSKVQESFGYSKDEILDIINSNDYSNDAQWKIAKIVRFYNMHLKLGHSARITYIAEQGLKDMPEGQNSEIIKRTVLLSALLHDVGRFYQAVHYNSLDDGVMKDNENVIAEIENGVKVSDLEVDHAIAGYYYSLASALELHELKNIDQYEDVLRFVTEAIAAVVVRYHQKNNSDIDYFDFKRPISFIQDSDLMGDLNEFINVAYDDAVLMNYDVDSEIDSDHKQFIQNFVNRIGTIIENKKLGFSDAEGFDYSRDFVESLQEELSTEIKELLKNIHGLSTDEVSDAIVDLVNEKIIKLTKTSMTEEERDFYKTEIKDTIKKLLNYDIAASINDMFKDDNKRREINPAVCCLISSALSLTMDADKIDILNQRALGIYNVSYRLPSLSVFPTDGMSMKDILKDWFHFDLEDDGFVIDDSVLSVVRSINSFSTDKEELQKDHQKIMDSLKERLGNVNIFDKDKFPEGTTIKVYHDKAIINGVEYPGNELYHLFNEEWLSYVLDGVIKRDANDFKSIKRKYADLLRITIKRDIFDENISDLDEDQQREAFKRLLVSDSLKKRFQLEGVNKPGNIWINAVEDHDTDHILRSNVTGLIWQFNQFLMVNMRRKSSYEVVQRYDMLNEIQKQYEKKDPMIASILKEYIDYAKTFVNYVLEHANDFALSNEDLSNMRKEVYASQNGNIKDDAYQM